LKNLRSSRRDCRSQAKRSLASPMF
jgi:hypothetical protein